MKTPNQTTSTPWKVEENVNAGGVNHFAITARHEPINWMPCSITPMRQMRDIDKANAALIVKSVNEYEALCKVAKAASECYKQELFHRQKCLPNPHDKARELMRDAIDNLNAVRKGTPPR